MCITKSSFLAAVCSPPAQLTALAVVAHLFAVGSGAGYRSARIGGNRSSLSTVMTLGLFPSLDSLIPSRIAHLITTYSTQRKSITATISSAIQKMAIRVSSTSSALVSNIVVSPFFGFVGYPVTVLRIRAL